MRRLRHYKGEWAGRPFDPEPWQTFCIASLFGWTDVRGRRRFRRGYIEVPKKNGKSTLCAPIALYLLAGDGEEGAEVYAAATKRDQARIVWKTAQKMVEQSPDLRQEILHARATSTLAHLKSASTFLPLGRDSEGFDGCNPHGAVIDELHLHPDDAVWETLTKSTIARRQPLVVAITTAGDDANGVCWDRHEHGVKVLEGSLEDDRFFAFIACADPEDPWDDPAAWRKANPSLGTTFGEQDLRDEVAAARGSPSSLAWFRRFHLNLWGQGAEKFLPYERWAACAALGDARTMAEALRGRPCWGGVDLSETTDLTAFVLVFPPEDRDAGVWRVLAWHWLPRERLYENSHRDNAPYAAWAEAGWLHATPGETVDRAFVRRAILEAHAAYDVREYGYDRWNMRETGGILEGAGLRMVEVIQGGRTLNEPMKFLLELVVSGRLAHGGNPLLSWEAGNLVARTDANRNLAPDKKASRRRIDGMSALLNALERALAVKPAADWGFFVV